MRHWTFPFEQAVEIVVAGAQSVAQPACFRVMPRLAEHTRPVSWHFRDGGKAVEVDGFTRCRSLDLTLSLQEAGAVMSRRLEYAIGTV